MSLGRVEPIKDGAKVQKIFHMCTRTYYVVKHKTKEARLQIR